MAGRQNRCPERVALFLREEGVLFVILRFRSLNVRRETSALVVPLINIALKSEVRGMMVRITSKRFLFFRSARL